VIFFDIFFSSVLWLGDRKGIQPVKHWVLVCQIVTSNKPTRSRLGFILAFETKVQGIKWCVGSLYIFEMDKAWHFKFDAHSDILITKSGKVTRSERQTD